MCMCVCVCVCVCVSSYKGLYSVFVQNVEQTLQSRVQELQQELQSRNEVGHLTELCLNLELWLMLYRRRLS